MRTRDRLLLVVSISIFIYPLFRMYSEQAVFPYNSRTSVRNLSPVDGERFYSGEEQTFYGRVYDPNNPVDEPVISCEMTHPEMNSQFQSGEVLTFTGTFNDLGKRSDTHSIIWESDLGGEILNEDPDISGETSFIAILSHLVIHDITLTVFDEAGGIYRDSPLIEILQPSELENDGDGFAVDEGDCNDCDSIIFAVASEIDDFIDNDCDCVNEENLPVTSIFVSSENCTLSRIPLDETYDRYGTTLT